MSLYQFGEKLLAWLGRFVGWTVRKSGGMTMPEKAPSAKASEAAARERYAQIRNPEIPFAQFQALDRTEVQRLDALAAGAAPPYRRGLETMTPCGGGDFETAIDLNEWQGAHGTLQQMAAAPSPDPFVSFTGGIFEGADSLGTSHQTWVPAGTDSKVAIPQTAPGSNGAVRVGNAVNGFGVDLLSKTFVVTSAQKIIKFWYAMVLQNPDPLSHPPADQPYFWVRVTDTSTGAVIPGAADLGGGIDKVVADRTNPFFQATSGGEIIVYKDWTCAQINLSAQVGKQVTVEFVTADCGQGGHWGYAYIDNFCGTCAGSPTGDFNFNAGASSGCGKGKLCFDYTLPTAGRPGATQTGTLEIKLEILQSGAVVDTQTSPVLTSGTSYCFDIDPAAIAGLDPALDGFDVVATGDFKIGTTTLAPLSVGAAPHGVRDGPNNDYQIACQASQAFGYAVKFVCGTQPSCDCACAPVLPGRYATEINIYNHGEEPAEIVKYVIPVVFGGAAAGREPRTVTARAEDRITLPPHAATMDDCCRLSELLLGAPADGPAPLSIGYLEIVSPVELTVTAVYTAAGLDGGPVSIEVEQFDAKPRVAPPHATPKAH
jgi:hypothetical protein